VRKIAFTGTDPRASASYTVSTLAGSTVSPPVAGSTDGVGAAATFNGPRGLALDTAGTALYVADMNNKKIRRVSFNGEVVTIAGTGSGGSTDGDGTGATFNGPQGIAAVAGGTLVVSDSSNNKLRQLRLKAGAAPGSAQSWAVQTLAGPAPGASTAGATDGTGDVALFSLPRGLAADSAHNLYVADYTNNKIRKLTPTDGFFPVGTPTGIVPAEPVQLANADGVIPSQGAGVNLPYVAYAGALDPNTASAVKPWVFTIPNGVTAFEFTVTVEANTRFFAPPFAVDNSATPGSGAGSPLDDVRTLAGSASFPAFQDGIATDARFASTEGIAVDQAGNVYVADGGTNSIRRISAAGVVSTVAGVLGTGLGSLDGPGNVASLRNPTGVAVTPDGTTLYVAEVDNDKIRRLTLIAGADPANPANWIVTTIAGTVAFGATPVDGRGDRATFNNPFGITLDPGGLLYVTEEGGNRVRRLQFTGGDPSLSTNWQVRTVAGDFNNAVGAVDGTGAGARFNLPTQIASDRAGNLYVADFGNNSIRKVTPDGLVTTFAGLAGASGYVDGTGAAAWFNQPEGIAVDSAGFVYVTDANARVRRISPSEVVTTVAGTGVATDVDGAGNVATFFHPQGVAVDAAGNLYISDSSVIRLIQRILTQGGP